VRITREAVRMIEDRSGKDRGERGGLKRVNANILYIRFTRYYKVGDRGKGYEELLVDVRIRKKIKR
jgi:hypothetical protein